MSTELLLAAAVSFAPSATGSAHHRIQLAEKCHHTFPCVGCQRYSKDLETLQILAIKFFIYCKIIINSLEFIDALRYPTGIKKAQLNNSYRSLYL